jgi:fumarate reductase subunit C
VNQPHSSTEFHPRWYRRRVSAYWWLQRGSYLRFILREVSSVFIGYTVAVILAQVYAVGQGENTYKDFLKLMTTPLFLVLNVAALFFVTYHAVTWFNLAPKALVVRMGGKPVPASYVAGSNYLAWLVVSVVMAWFLLGRAPQ